MGDNKKERPDIPVFFDVRDSSYWYRIRKRFIKLGARDIKLHLRRSGLSEVEWIDGLRELDWPLWDAQTNKQVDYAGPLAGHRVGSFKCESGRVLLVTEEAPGLWDPLPKKPKLPRWFIGFIKELLPDEQWLHFCHWLRFALVSLREGDFRPGQMVVLAGPSQCGKSLLQYIITHVLGGRAASPFRYLMGETQFNNDFTGAEHWAIEDPSSSTDVRTRRAFGARLKEATVNRDFPVHPKGKDAMLLKLFRRVTLSVNDEPENLSVIPPLDRSILEKMFLFKCSPATVGSDRKKIEATVRAEVPLIRAWLLQRLGELPKEFHDNRFGVLHWAHPELLAELSDMSPESRLLALIDHVLFEQDKSDDPVPFIVPMLELEKRLRSSAFSFQVEKLLHYSTACGVYLSRLAKSHPSRVSKRGKDGATLWQINPPPQQKDDNA